MFVCMSRGDVCVYVRRECWYEYIDHSACVCICVHVCVHVCMYVHVRVRVYVHVYVCMHVCMQVCMHVCMQVCMQVPDSRHPAFLAQPLVTGVETTAVRNVNEVWKTETRVKL